MGRGGLGSKDRGRVPRPRGLSALQQESEKPAREATKMNRCRKSKNSTPDTNMTTEAPKRGPGEFFYKSRDLGV